MPQAPKRPCSHPGCGQLQPCAIHTRKLHETTRVGASERGYGWKWAQYAKRYLKQHPLCRMCEQVNRVEVADMVDHIIPVKSAEDPRFWDPANHQPLSRQCHALKTAEDIRKGLTR